MSRHRGEDQPRSSGEGYAGAGKRRRVDSPPVESLNGRHRGARRRLATPSFPVSTPQLMGGLAVIGLLGGTSTAAAFSVPSAPVAASAPTTAARPPFLETLGGRKLPVSRSAIRDLEATIAQARQRDARRWVLPVSGYHLTGRFGDRSSLWSTVHTGLDFAASTGTAIHAIAAGTVTGAGWANAYGYRTIVTLGDGTEIWYCHQSRMDVTVGTHVQRGQVIGAVGDTGNSTGPHVHVEVRPGGGAPVDPQVALSQHGATP